MFWSSGMILALPCIHLLISQQYYGIRKCVLLCGFTETQSTGSEAKCSACLRGSERPILLKKTVAL